MLKSFCVKFRPVISACLHPLSSSLFLQPQSLLWLTTGRDSIEQDLVITLLVIMGSAPHRLVIDRVISARTVTDFRLLLGYIGIKITGRS